MVTNRVLQIDKADLETYYHLDTSDLCYYTCEYIAGAGYKAGPGNNLISNLKKPESDKTKNPWAYKYKTRAIQEVAQLLANSFAYSVASQYVFVPIPPSKIPDDIEYDDRLFIILNLFAKHILDKHGTTIKVRKMVVQTQNYEAAHKSVGERPKLEFYENIYKVHEMDGDALPEKIILFDDVLTTGAHFKAAKNVLQRYFLSKYNHKVSIFGLFIAKTIWDGRSYGFNVMPEKVD